MDTRRPRTTAARGPGALFPSAVAGVSPFGAGQDRAEAIETDGGLVLVLADGAGGVAGGASAAERVLDETRGWIEALGRLPDPAEWARWLTRLDERLLADPDAGESTAVVVSVSSDGIHGASVGDSEAWLVTTAGITDLTSNRRRKPLLGTGEAIAVPFHHAVESGLLLVGSDGLVRFVKEDAVRRAAAERDVGRAAHNLVESVRLPSGDLIDDTTVILCRIDG